MSKVIGEVNLNPSRIEGTPDQVAIHIFKEVICPSTEGLLKNNPEAAKVLHTTFWFSAFSTSRVSFNQKSR